MIDDEGIAVLKAAVGEIMTGSGVMAEMRRLCDRIGPRPVGSEGEKLARDHILERLRALGLEDVAAEPFEAPLWRRGSARGRIASPIDRPFPLVALLMNGTHAVRARAVWAPFETMEEFERIAPRLEGRICVNRPEPKIGLSGSMLHRAERIKLVCDAGGAGFLWVGNWPGHVLPTGSMDPRSAESMPAFGIGYEDGMLLRRLSERGETEVLLEEENSLGACTSWNVRGDLPGASADAPTVLLSAHYDSHDITEGAFDNAAGTAIVIEAARALSRHWRAGGCRVRFVIFSAEEMGLVGSRAYVAAHASELDGIRLMFNCDGLGVMPSTKYVHVFLGADLADYIRSVYARFGYPAEVENRMALNWDHAPFALSGVPVASITAKWPAGRMLHYGHTASDTLDKIDPDDMRNLACYATVIVSHAALDPDWDIRRPAHGEAERCVREAGKGHLLDQNGYPGAGFY